MPHFDHRYYFYNTLISFDQIKFDRIQSDLTANNKLFLMFTVEPMNFFPSGQNSTNYHSIPHLDRMMMDIDCNHDTTPQQQGLQSISQQTIGSNTNQKCQKKLKKSENHNLQKHAVVTILKMVDLSYLDEQNEIHQCAKAIWHEFGKTVKNRQTLVSLFEKSIEKKFAFTGILEKYSYDIVQAAQSQLRSTTIHQLTASSIQKHLHLRRKMNQKTKAKLLPYLFLLIEELQGGRLSLRMDCRKFEEKESKMNKNFHEEEQLNGFFDF